MSTSTHPLKLTLALTYRCNLRCKICGIWGIYQEHPEKVEEELTLEDYRQLFSSLNKLGPIYLEFTGGEPFLRNDVDEILINAVKIISSIKACAITTNGYNPDHILTKVKNALEELPERIKLILGVSLDGVENVHNHIRDQKDSWKNSVETFTLIRNMTTEHPNLTPHFSYTINTYNAGNFSTLYKSLSDKINVTLHDFSVTLEQNGVLYHRNDDIKLDHEMVSRDIDFILENRVKDSRFEIFSLARESFYDFYLKNLKVFLKNPDKMIIPCAASTLSAYIDPYGSVHPCISWDEIIGNIKEKNFNEIWSSNRNKQIRKLINRNKCPICWTPCEAQPSLLMSLPKAYLKART